MVDNKSEHDRKHDNAEHRKEHRADIDINGLPCIEKSKERCHDRGEQRRNCCHADGKRDIAMREIRHNIGRGSTRAGADENDANGKLCGKPKHFAEDKGDQRHQRELTDGTQDNVLRVLENLREIRSLQRKAHTKHDDSQQIINPGCANPCTCLRRKQSERRNREHNQCHPFSDKITCLFECFQFFPSSSAPVFSSEYLRRALILKLNSVSMNFFRRNKKPVSSEDFSLPKRQG